MGFLCYRDVTENIGKTAGEKGRQKLRTSGKQNSHILSGRYEHARSKIITIPQNIANIDCTINRRFPNFYKVTAPSERQTVFQRFLM